MTHERAGAEDEREATPPRMPRLAGQQPVERAPTRVVTAVIVAVVVFLYLVRSILLPFVIAGAIAFVCTPLIDRLVRVTRLPRWIAATFVCCTILLAAACLAYLALPSLLQEIGTTIANLQPTIEHALQTAFGTGPIEVLGQKTDATQLASQIVDAVRAAIGHSDVVTGIVAGGAAVALGLIMTLVLFIYLMVSGPAVASGLLRLVPPQQRPLIAAIWAELDPVLFRYFAGLAIVVAYATLAAYLGLAFLLHLPNATLLAVITGFLEVVPIVGPAASAVLAGAFAIHAAPSLSAIITYVVFVIVFRLSVDQVVSPLVLGRAGRVHPVVIIFSFLSGGALFGIAGIILAIPVALTIKTVLAVLYEEPPVPGAAP